MTDTTEAAGEFTKTEVSLLLYFETCAVDRGGRVDSPRLNDEDRQIAERWNETGFVLFGRVILKDVGMGGGALWCQLSPEAWRLAHLLRKERARRGWEGRTWASTAEKREGARLPWRE